MWKKLVNRSLITASVLVGASLALASPSNADTVSSKVLSFSPEEITQVGVNASGTAYKINGPIDFSAKVNVKLDAETSGRIKYWKSWLSFSTEDYFDAAVIGGGPKWIEFEQYSVEESYPTFHRPKTVDDVVSIEVPAINQPGLFPHFDIMAVTFCNSKAAKLRAGGMSNLEIFSADRTVEVVIRPDMSYEMNGLNGSFWGFLTNSDLGQAGSGFSEGFERFNLVCKGSVPPPDTAKNFDFDPGPFKINDIKLILSTYSNSDTQANSVVDKTCKRGQIKVRLTASKAGLAIFELWTKRGAAPVTSEVIGAWASSDGAGGFQAEHVKWVDVDNTTILQAKAIEMIGLGLNTPWKDITLSCTGSGSDFTHDTSDYEATATMELYDIDAGKKNDTTCPRNGRIIFAFSSNYSFPIKYRLTSNTGIDKSGTLEMFKSGDEWKGLVITPFPVEETVEMGAVLRQTRNGATKFVATATKTFNCITPIVNPGSDDVATTPLPDPDAPRSSWSGEVTVADSSGPKVCPREGQAFFEVQTDAPGSFDYRLNCTNGQFFTGSKQSFGSPGNYNAFGAHNINITKSRNIHCSLQEVRPNGVRITIAKGGHQFVCKTLNAIPGSDDLTHRPNPSPSSQGTPQVAITCKSDEYHVKGSGECAKIPGVSILCKPGFELKDDSCVKTPVIGIIGTTSSGLKAAEAAKRRKAAQAAKRRKAAQAAKRRKAKADAARAAERRKKAAQAGSLRKRAAAAAKRRKAKEDAARAAKRRKAAAQAAARRKAEQRRKARRAEARRKAAAAVKRSKATQRRKVKRPRRRPARAVR